MTGTSSLISRLLRMLALIHGSHRWTPSGLAEAMSTTERTVYRDLRRLRESGVPIQFDHASNGYCIVGRFFLPPVDLTPEEACSLVMLTERVGGSEQLPLTRSAATAIEKLRALLPSALREALDEFMPRVTVHLAASESDGIDDVWATVSKAIAERMALRCVYDAANHDEDAPDDGAFRFDPYDLYFGQRAWYAVGLHHGRDAVRTLKLARFSRIELTDQSYAIPPDFSLQQYFGRAWRMMPGGEVHQVRLRFSRDVADTVEGTIWHSTQQVSRHEDGSITVTFEVDGLDEIVWWVLSYGPHCVAEGPQQLRERVTGLLTEATNRYRS